ncbi:hypothetical protein AV540_12905 [Brevibacillus parabrevis]|uniref:hypothetical protein n=1 Tax=Brevibacillus parabrevis TaxID=54914 RepID=UPI0007ABD613|nr:hypothetical protein [Brevibacillus parabrevis]KZE51758.1 hypothetical protein AV540_12905 [Brevibacillus parabrevis]
MYWSDRAVAYADVHRLDFIDAVDIVVPVEHRAEVKTIVSLNGGAKAQYQAGDVPSLGLGAAGAGAAATIKNSAKAATKGTSEIPKRTYEPSPKHDPKMDGEAQIQFQMLKQDKNYWKKRTHHPRTSNYTTFMVAKLSNFNQMEKQGGIHMKLRILLKKFLQMY